MAVYTQGLVIDGIIYDIPFVKISRTMDFLEKYAERTEDGDIKIETIGLYRMHQSSLISTATFLPLRMRWRRCLAQAHSIKGCRGK